MVWRISLIVAVFTFLLLPLETRAAEVSADYLRLKRKLLDIDEYLGSLTERRDEFSSLGDKDAFVRMDELIRSVSQQREQVSADLARTPPYTTASSAPETPETDEPAARGTPTKPPNPQTADNEPPANDDAEPAQTPTTVQGTPGASTPPIAEIQTTPTENATENGGTRNVGDPNTPTRSVIAPIEDEVDQILSNIAEGNRAQKISAAEIYDWDLDEPESTHAGEAPPTRPIVDDATVESLNSLADGRLRSTTPSTEELDTQNPFLDKSIARAQDIKSALENGEEVSLEDIVEAIENLQSGVSVNVNVPSGGADAEVASAFREALQTIAEIRGESPPATTIISSGTTGALSAYNSPSEGNLNAATDEEKRKRPRTVTAKDLYKKGKLKLKDGEKQDKFIRLGKKKAGKDLGTLAIKGKKDSKTKISSSLIAALTKTLKAKRNLKLSNQQVALEKKKNSKSLVKNSKNSKLTKPLSLRELKPREASTLSFWSDSLSKHPQIGWAIGCLLAFFSGALLFHRKA